MTTFDTTLTIGDDDIDIRVTYEAWWQKAKTYGEPENCYPADGDMEIIAATPLQDLPGGMTEKDFQAHAERCAHYIEEMAWGDFHENF